MTSSDKGCKHLDARIIGHSRIGYAECPSCGLEVWLADVFNNLLDKVRKEINMHSFGMKAKEKANAIADNMSIDRPGDDAFGFIMTVLAKLTGTVPENGVGKEPEDAARIVNESSDIKEEIETDKDEIPF